MTFFEKIAIPLIRDRGFKVAPCFPRKKEVHTTLIGKTPQKKVSNDPLQIAEWGEREPDANVCVYALQEEGGFCFLDKDGANDLRAAYEKETGRQFPKTLFVRSSSVNGVEKGHWYFLQTSRTRSFEKNITEDATNGWFSFRVKNEYVCSIGSIHPDTNKPYQIVEDFPLAPIPDDLLDWLQSQAVHRPKTRKEAIRRGKFQKGQRYTALMSETGRLWSRGWGRDLTVKAGIAWAKENFSLPEGFFDEQLVRKDIEHLIDSYPPGEPEDPFSRFKNTETANADRLIKKYGEVIRYCSDRKVWCVWDGATWNVDDSGSISRCMRDTGMSIYKEAAETKDDDERKALSKWAVVSESRRVRENSIALARSIKNVEVREFAKVFDTHPLLLNVKNGTVDLRTGQLSKHERDNFITKLVPIEYDENASCEQFTNFIGEALPGAGLALYLLKVAGYCLTGITSEQKWWMFHGVTASGKSTLINVLHGLLGPYALALPENYFLITNNTKDYATANLAGVRLATCVETNEGRRLDTAKLKSLTGGDVISAELKYQNCFTFRPQMKLILATNNKPHVSASDDAIWRRLMPVPFTQGVKEENRVADLSAQLLEKEGPGILRWAVLGCKAWLNSKLAEPEIVLHASAEYRRDEDNVQTFLSECCIMEGDTERKELYSAYVNWCKSNHVYQINAVPFGRDLARLGVLGDKGNRKWFGVRVRQLGEPQSEIFH